VIPSRTAIPRLRAIDFHPILSWSLRMPVDAQAFVSRLWLQA